MSTQQALDGRVAIVTGASRGIGAATARALSSAGAAVVLAARDADALHALAAEIEATRHERLRVVAGDALDRATIDVVLPGHTAVLSALGATTRARTTIYSRGTANLCRSMTAAGVRRLVCLSFGALDSGAGTPAAQRLVTRLIIRPPHRHAYADMRRMEDELAADDRVDWTVVRAPMLTNGPHTGAYRFTHDGDRPLDRPTQISRADLADFVLGHLDDHALFRRRVSLSY